jgi:hypothetical protein
LTFPGLCIALPAFYILKTIDPDQPNFSLFIVRPTAPGPILRMHYCFSLQGVGPLGPTLTILPFRTCSAGLPDGIGDRRDVLGANTSQNSGPPALQPSLRPVVPRTPACYIPADIRANASPNRPANFFRHDSIPTVRSPFRAPSIFYSFVFSTFRVAF